MDAVGRDLLTIIVDRRIICNLCVCVWLLCERGARCMYGQGVPGILLFLSPYRHKTEP